MRVVCFGVLVADLFVPPLPQLPAPGELVSTGEFLMAPGGCAANVAVALRRLGVAVAVGGRVGVDPFGAFVIDALAERGIDTRGVVRTPGVGTSKTVIVPVVGEDRRYLHTFGANAALCSEDLLATPWRSAEVIYVGGYLILPSLREERLAPHLAEARARGGAVILDVVAPSGARPSPAGLARLLPHVDYFVPNHDEARALTGLDDPRLQAERLVEQGARTVMIKLGERGLYVRGPSGEFHLDAPPVEVVEPSGAGDAFAAGLALAILERWELEQAASFASVLGGSACTALGCEPGVFTRDAAEAFLAKHPLAPRVPAGAP